MLRDRSLIKGGGAGFTHKQKGGEGTAENVLVMLKGLGGGVKSVILYQAYRGGGGKGGRHNKFRTDDFYYFVALPFPVTNDRSLTGDVRPMVQLFVAFEKKTGSF